LNLASGGVRVAVDEVHRDGLEDSWLTADAAPHGERRFRFKGR
jgi:hypothetical protein